MDGWGVGVGGSWGRDGFSINERASWLRSQHIGNISFYEPWLIIKNYKQLVGAVFTGLGWAGLGRGIFCHSEKFAYHK